MAKTGEAEEKILIVGPAWVGDMVMAQSLLMTLKRDRPNAVLDVAAPAWTRPLLDRMPEVRRAIFMPFGHGGLDLKARKALGRSLLAERYDQAIVLPNSWKSALVPFFAKIPRRTGWNGEMRIGLLNDRRVLDKTRLPKMTDRFNALAFDKDAIKSEADFVKPHPLPRLVVDRTQRELSRHKFGLGSERPVLALCPGAEFGPSKRWPEQHYAEVAAQKAAEGWQVWLFGSQQDAAICETIRSSVPDDRHVINLAGKTSLAEAIDLLSLADAVVSNDSGLMHVVAALGRPLVALYGSTSPFFTPPLTDAKRLLSLQLSCSPCFKRECPLGHHDCLRILPATMALGALAELEALS